MTDTNISSSHSWSLEKQWVARVVEFSSQYNETTWSANQVIGPPKVYPRHGDIQGAWAQGNRANNEFIVVEFERAFYPSLINIYETYNPGAVVRVSIRNGNEDNRWQVVWENAAPHVEARSRIFSVPIENLDHREINQVRLDVNCSAAGNWCEIDAIELVGHASLRGTAYKELIHNMKLLLDDDCLADVSFILDDGKIVYSHRNILESRCFYFEQLLQKYSSNQSDPIPISNISHGAFYQILHFIFTDRIEPVLSYEICLELMRKADEFYLNSIYTEAFDILKKVINKNNVVKVILLTGFADENRALSGNDLILQDAIDFCVEFIRKFRRDIYASDQMSLLDKDNLIKLIQLVQ